MRVQFSIAVCLAWAMLAVAVAVEEDLPNEQVLDFEDAAEPVALKTNGATARSWDWAKKMAKWMGYDYEEYEDEEYYDYYYPVQYEGHHVPAAGGHHLQPVATGAHAGSSYVSYQPHPAQFHNSRDDYVTDDDDWSIMDMMFDMAVTVVPLGLLLAALPSGLFTFAVRRRSLGGDNIFDNLVEDSFEAGEMPILRDLIENDLLAFTTRECQERIFCEISQLGEKDKSSTIQKGFYYAAALTPDFVARKAGLADLFRITRYGQCEILRCGPSPPIAFAPVSNDLAPTIKNKDADLTEPSKE